MSLQGSSSLKFSSGAVGVVGVCAGLGLTFPAGAAPVVGTATEITQSVTGGFGRALSPLSVNEQVILNETVQTDASGEGRFTLEESTNLVVFARSSIKVARFTPSNVVMTTADGTFAVTTGRLAPGSYRVETSAGTLTPHGTKFWFIVHGGRLKLDVQEGAVTFCPRGKSKAFCVDAVPGHSVVGQAGAAPQFGDAGPPPTSPPPPMRFTQTPPQYPPGGTGRESQTWTGSDNQGNPYGCTQANGPGFRGGGRGSQQCGIGSRWRDAPPYTVGGRGAMPFYGGGRNMPGFGGGHYGFGGIPHGTFRHPYRGGF